MTIKAKTKMRRILIILVRESRITTFPTINDAYIQNGQGYDQNIIRLQENFRRSYLMFDLTPIETINGKITAASLRLIVDADDGNGTIKAYKATLTDWSEDSLTEETAPEVESQIGAVVKTYEIGNEVEIELNISELPIGVSTLILEHENGDDLAFASKENTSKLGPKLEVIYEAPVSSEVIVVDDVQNIEQMNEEEEEEEEENGEGNTADDETSGDETDNDTSDDENTNNEEDTTDENAEDTNTDEETPDNQTEEEDSNTAPTANAVATPLSGIAPLTVNFNANTSSDDKEITSYEWNFKDGSPSNNIDPTHTFETPGTYAVQLTIWDEEGLSNSDVVTITVASPQIENEPPVSVAVANQLTGEAPLAIDFIGSNSTDDKGIVSYLWNFQEATSTDVNPSYTFTNAGNYVVTLTVTDDEGLQATSSLSITVNSEPPSNPVTTGPIPCSVGGSRADIPGEKVWCWSNLATEINAVGPLASFSSGQLAKSANYDGQSISVSNNRLRFKLNPNTPNSGNGNNYRSEIRENPSNVDHALGTEQWFGWDYKFENDYKPDAFNEWIMWQVHGSFSNPVNPLVSLWVAKENMAKHTNVAGEIFVANAAINSNNTKYVPTGVVSQAGQTLKIVVHVIWGDANTGLYEVWINGNKVYSEHERTVYVEQPEGGYAKWGIYKWKWRHNSNVSSSANQGITELNTSMGTLRSIMRRLGDSDYGKDAYSLVAPD